MSVRHMPALDGLRGVAILLVIPHNCDVYPAEHGWLYPFAALAHMGWLGVQLFFVLSGFLITQNLLATRGNANYFRTFFARRILRIFPLYFLTLIFFLFFLPQVLQLSPAIVQTYRHQGWLWVFLSNWAEPFGKSVYWFPHFWSLAVEEQFYLVWPLVIALVALARLPAVCCGVIIAAFCMRVLLLALGGTTDMAYQFTNCRMDALAFGALLAVLMTREPIPTWISSPPAWLRWSVIASLAVLAAASHGFGPNNLATMTVGYPLLSFAMMMLVALCASSTSGGVETAVRSALSTPWLRSVGRYSFAMYIFHLPLTLLFGVPVLEWLKPLGAPTPLVYALLLICASYGVAALSYTLIESHFLRLKRYFNATRARAPVLANT